LSPKRADFKRKYGKQLSGWRKSAHLIKVPLLIDPNTGAELFESADIVRYLFETYQDGPTVQESFWDYGKNDKKSR